MSLVVADAPGEGKTVRPTERRANDVIAVLSWRCQPRSLCNRVAHGIDFALHLKTVVTGKHLLQWTLSEQVANVAFASDSRHPAVALMMSVVYILRLESAPDSR